MMREKDGKTLFLLHFTNITQFTLPVLFPKLSLAVHLDYNKHCKLSKKGSTANYFLRLVKINIFIIPTLKNITIYSGNLNY